MAFTEHKITAFQKKIADLPDQPNLSAAELKAYFDSSPEELRQSVNDLCTDAARLDNRVSGIVAETFGDTIPKMMLSDELQKEIDAKAEEFANTKEHAAFQAQLAAQATQIAQKCEVYCGTYTGDNTTLRTIELGFEPLAVYVVMEGTQASDLSRSTIYGGLALRGFPAKFSNRAIVQTVENGFQIMHGTPCYPNNTNQQYFYMAFR